MGRLFEKEYCVISELMESPEKPCVFVLGGSKISDAFIMMETVLKGGSADKVLTGGLVGNILPAAAVNALSVSLYGMFLAIIIPPARKDRFIGGLVLLSMAASWVFSVLPLTSGISSGFKVIILTIVLAAAAAVLKPVEEQAQEA